MQQRNRLIILRDMIITVAHEIHLLSPGIVLKCVNIIEFGEHATMHFSLLRIIIVQYR